MKAVVIVDTGGANLASLRYALARLGTRAVVSRDARQIAGAARVLLPGVGAAAPAMRRLERLGLVPVLRALTQPVLGICLGMQLLCARSEEGPAECLGLLPEPVRAQTPAPGRPVPHMGGNALRAGKSDPLLAGVPDGSYAYFVHSYMVAPGEHVLAHADYGTPLAAAVRRANFWGTQFHPERSAATGAQLLRNFLAL
ncbi:MAG TPA: imidazole glycerol phosphate synthase subunit HisH [Steroidobacteraceae bacterium]|nr:imidazole glycerol phosphate synthase subunit HisH [Steroidobacteraceae bacterium]